MWRAKTRAEKRKRALAKQGEAPGGDAASASGAGKAGGKAGGGKAGGRGSKGGKAGRGGKGEEGRRPVLKAAVGGFGCCSLPLQPRQQHWIGSPILNFRCWTHMFPVKWHVGLCRCFDLTPGGISIDAPMVRRLLVRMLWICGLPSSRTTHFHRTRKLKNKKSVYFWGAPSPSNKGKWRLIGIREKSYM